MKKVRYAAGAIGMAPALGLMLAPAAQATPTQGHTAQKEVKRVSLMHTNGGNAVTSTCTGSFNGYTFRNGNGFGADLNHTGHCVSYQQTALYHLQSKLTERVRYYNAAGARIYESFNFGHFYNHSGVRETLFSTYPYVSGAYNVCFALVANSNRNDVKYGPLCIGV
jgi:hypothetical protein